MASPQLENGYIRISNEIWKELRKIRIPGECMQILMCILEKTYGFNKKEDWISLSQFCDMTGIKKPNIIRAINKLRYMNIIIKKDNVIKKDNASGATYCFQKDFSKWRPLSKKIMTVIKKDNDRYQKRYPQKTILQKTIKTKNIYAQKLAHFDAFWKVYPKKRSKGQAEKAFMKLDMSSGLFEKIIKAVEVAKQSDDWQKDSGQYIPHPATWINAKGWEDEVTTKKEIIKTCSDCKNSKTCPQQKEYREKGDVCNWYE